MEDAARHHPGRGVRKAAAYAPRRVSEALREFRSLNSREARAAFADHWIGLWASEFDDAWPMLYELLHIVEEEKLYADPRRVGPGAPGGAETHGEAESYSDFAAYFEDRVKRPFETWSEMEGTYHYAQKYAPDLLKKAFAVARNAKERVTQGAQALAKAIKDEVLAINSGDGPLTGIDRANRNIMTVSAENVRGTNAEYLMRRIARDHPAILERACTGEFPSARAAAIEAGIAPHTQSVRMDDAESAARTIRKHMPPDTRRVLARLLIDDLST